MEFGNGSVYETPESNYSTGALHSLPYDHSQLVTEAVLRLCLGCRYRLSSPES